MLFLECSGNDGVGVGGIALMCLIATTGIGNSLVNIFGFFGSLAVAGFYKWLLLLWAHVGLTYWTTAYPSDWESSVWVNLID